MGYKVEIMNNVVGIGRVVMGPQYTVRCRYNAVKFLQYPYSRHIIARPASYVGSFVSLKSDLRSATIVAAPCVISCKNLDSFITALDCYKAKNRSSCILRKTVIAMYSFSQVMLCNRYDGRFSSNALLFSIPTDMILTNH